MTRDIEPGELEAAEVLGEAEGELDAEAEAIKDAEVEAPADGDGEGVEDAVAEVTADEVEDGPEDAEVGGDGEISTQLVVEAVLFAADEPVSPSKIVEILGTSSVKEVREYVGQLNEKYEQAGCAFGIEEIAGGYLMLTQGQYNPWLRKLLKVRSESKLSPAALETLAIIAYKQPILRVDIEAIRGVAAGEMVRQLCDKGLVKIVGRAEELGRPLLYGTTKKFLEVFGLSSLKELPTAEDLKAPQ